jgi:anthranilate synthase component 1
MNDFSEKRDSTTAVIPVVETIPADLLTPLSVYLKLSAGTANSFLLESVEGGTSLARYSFIGADPEFVVAGNDEQYVFTGKDGSEKKNGGVLDLVKAEFARAHAHSDAVLPTFIGGAIGYLGFECSAWFEPSLKTIHSQNNGEAAFMFYRSVVAFDHAKQVIKIISLVFGSDGDDLEALKRNAAEANHSIRRRLESGQIVIPNPEKGGRIAAAASNWERNAFETAVAEIKEMIKAGDCYQAVLSQRFSKPTNATPVGIYRALRSINPSPYMFLLQFDDKAVVGASPEMLVKCIDDRLEYRPIAGTRPRGTTAAEDDELADEMRLDKKEVAEHLMLVDLGRNDLGRVAEYGSVRVDTLMAVEKYSHVQHLVSSLSAKLRRGLSRFDALAACFPAGTVSGAPKVRATEIIRDLEPDKRGIYAGAVGYFDYSGNMDTCIAIRTLVLENGTAHIQAGAGIVADSIPASEFEETVNKAKVLLRAVEIAEWESA